MKKFMNLAKATVVTLTLMLTTVLFAQTPGIPSSVDGPFILCQGEEVVFSISSDIENAEKTIWTVPYGMVILDGYNTNEILVYVDSMYQEGQVSVQGWNRNGHFGNISSLVVDVRDLPFTPP